MKNIHALGVFAVHPPGEVEQKFVEDTFEKLPIGFAAHALFDLVDAPRRPGMHRRIYVTESPFVRRQLPVRMHVPLAKKQSQLFLGEVRIDLRERDTVEREIPSRIPGILPLIRHGNNVCIVKIGPLLIAALLARFRRPRSGGIALEPGANVEMIKLLGPEQAGERLPLNIPSVLRNILGSPHRVELVGFFASR